MVNRKTFSRAHRLSLLLTTFVVITSTVSAQEWVDRSTNITHQTGNVSFSGRWDPAAGLHLKVSTPDRTRSVVLEASGKEGKIVLTPEKAFPPCVTEGSQFNLAALPSNQLASASFVLKFRQETWALYVENRPIAVFPAPFFPPAVLSQPKTELPPEDQRQVKLQQTADIRFHDDFLVPEETEDDAKLVQWDKLSGTWLLHTAGESAIERAYIAATAKKSLKPAFSSNFYSIKGSGTNAVIATGYDFYDSYSMEAAIRTQPGEMGLVFYLQTSGGYHAFTVRMEEDSEEALLSLWRTASTNNAPREILDAVSTRITHGQWVLLKVRTFQNRIQCYMDNIKLLDVPAELPVGGRFGLFVSSDTGIRFDDVTAESNHDLDFLGISDVRRQALAIQGSFFPKKRFFNLFGAAESGNFMKPEVSDEAQWLLVGSTAHGGHVFSADFEPERPDRPWCVGLLMGYTGTNQPHLRFTSLRSGGLETFVLEKVTAARSEILEQMSLTLPADEKPHSVSLMADATSEQEVRLYRNGQLVLIHPLTSTLQGASGVYVGPQTRVRISNPSYQFERDDLYRNKFEKNQHYVEDPFMLHWSSPEGQWLEETNGLTWHQGDFFGRFLIQVPYTNNTEVHVGVEEGQTNGALVVAARADDISLYAGPTVRRDKPLARAVTSLFCKPPPATNFFTVHYEGYWVWVSGGDKLLFKHQLQQPLKGRRARLGGFASAQLKDTYVERYNVKDYLFTESLHDWVINGGQWEVINRFQCDPRWSHMNGESTNGLAAIWTKYLFKGDFCMELYAGTRMGWYERCGDFNITLMNPRTTSSEGYTATGTGWDYDHSQLYTRLYRNGNLLGQTDKYLVPRYREGNKRMGFEPLLKAGGRDVHGAWYYIKLRRVGKRLEYYFDNELALAVDDPNPLAEGSAGIWTYLNSMMVARVKIAAEAIRPKPFPFTSTLVLLPDFSRPSVMEGPSTYVDVLKDGRPMESLTATNWDMDDSIGHSVLTWHEEGGTGPYFVAENVLGGGAMFVRCKLPPVPYPDIAGWRFLLKRTPGARFNLHYSIGRKKENGDYVAEQQFFHRISGPEFSLGRFKMAGESDVPATDATHANWHASGTWSPVEAWAATEGLRTFAKDTNLLVRVEGFGILQPSYEAQGLLGNAPGDGYAVKDFAEIRYDAPHLTLATNLPPPRSLSVLDSTTRKPLVTSTNLAGVQAWIDRTSTNGFFRPVLLVERTNGVSRNTLAWVRLPDTAAFSCKWSERYPSTVALHSDTPYPDRRFAFALLSVGNTLSPLTDDPSGDRLAIVPRRFDCNEATSNALTIMVAIDGRTRTFSLLWKNCPLREPPVLLKIEGLTPLYEGFERRELVDPLVPDPARMTIEKFDPEQGSYLEVFNTEANQRLRTGFAAPLSMARHPLVQFRYRGTNMASVSLSLGDAYYAKLSEENPNARAVRAGQALRLDGHWHTWLGFVSDAMTDRPFDSKLMNVQSATLASYAGIDQTGRYTRWDVDDVAVGPAVSAPEQLAFAPYYFDFSGVQTVSMAVQNGLDSYTDLPPEKARSLKWREIPNITRTTPDLEGLTNGVCHLFLKARNRRGEESRVVSIPFVLDRQPLEATSATENSDDPLANGTVLRVNFTNPGNGAPLDLERMKVRWDDRDVAVPALCSTLAHLPERDSLVLNWPYIFREQLNQSKHGQTFKIVIANVLDGASNAAPDIVVPMTIDYEKDHRPPTILQTDYPTNILWSTPWEVGSEKGLFFAAGAGVASTTLVRPTNDAPYLCSVTTTNGGKFWHSFEAAPWSIAAYPYLGLRICRPTIASNDPARIDLEFEFVQGQTNILSLTHTATGTNALTLAEPIVWRSNVWYSLTFDLPQLLKDQYKPEQMKDLKIKFLRFARSGDTTTNALYMQSFYVFGPWKPVDRVKMNAYDASGMEGITWARETASQDMVLAPASLPVQDQGTGWLAMRARDRAGNLSAPLWVPVFSTNAPPPAAGAP